MPAAWHVVRGAAKAIFDADVPKRKGRNAKISTGGVERHAV